MLRTVAIALALVGGLVSVLAALNLERLHKTWVLSFHSFDMDGYKSVRDWSAEPSRDAWEIADRFIEDQIGPAEFTRRWHFVGLAPDSVIHVRAIPAAQPTMSEIEVQILLTDGKDGRWHFFAGGSRWKCAGASSGRWTIAPCEEGVATAAIPPQSPRTGSRVTAPPQAGEQSGMGGSS